MFPKTPKHVSDYIGTLSSQNRVLTVYTPLSGMSVTKLHATHATYPPLSPKPQISLENP